MGYERIEAMLDGKSGGFTPKKQTESDDVLAERIFGSEPSVEDEDESEKSVVEAAAPEPQAERESAPEVERADEDDLETLRAAGWDESELKTITRDAAQRHALREMRRGKSERTAAPVEDAEAGDLEATLAEELGKGTAKKVAPFLSKQQERIAALERSLLSQRVERVVAEFAGAYPEFQRSAVVRDAVIKAAVEQARQGETDSQAVGRVLKQFYGPRSAKQTPTDRAEARAQVDSQVSGATRTAKSNKVSKDEAAYAAFRHAEKTGDLNGATQVRKRLGY